MSVTVAFFDQSNPGPSGPITAWAWDFGDGGTSTSQNPSHVYASPGTYSVQLEVTGTSPDGTDSVTAPVSATVVGPDLTALFSVSLSSLAATFTDLSTPGPSGPITAWDWDFGDGTPHGTTQNPSHTYAAAGTYTVTLTVTGTSPDGTDDITHTVAPSGSSNFVSATSRTRPTTLAGTSAPHQKPFTTLAELKTLIAAATTGDYIYYNGTGRLLITSGTGPALTLTGNKQITIDFGTRKSIWDPTLNSGDYVEFQYSGTGQGDAFVIRDASNYTLYGGSLTGPLGGGSGFRIFGNSSHILWYDGYVHHVGGSGVMIQPINGSTGASSSITNCDFMFEVDRCCMYPAVDTHADKGSGMHGVIIHGNSGHWDDSRCIAYVHDPLQPGETSHSLVWPEGACGSAIEAGTDSTGGATSQNNNSYGYLALNLLMDCTGTNPGSNGAKQTGGNGINWWGSVPINSTEIEWAEVINISGQSSHGGAGGWHTGSPAIHYLHGRSDTTNSAYPNNNLSSPTDPYDRRWGITYTDCT